MIIFIVTVCILNPNFDITTPEKNPRPGYSYLKAKMIGGER